MTENLNGQQTKTEAEEDSSGERKTCRSIVLKKKKKSLKVRLKGHQKEFLLERKGKVIVCRWTENRKGAGTNSGESGVRNLEAESIRSGAESTGGRVKLKTVTERRRV